MRRRAWIVAAAVLAVGLLVGCGSSSSTSSSASSSSSGGGSAANASSSKSPVVIGTSLSLSGDFSADGQAFQKGYEL